MKLMFKKQYNDFNEKEKWFYYWFTITGWRLGYSMIYNEKTQEYSFFSPLS